MQTRHEMEVPGAPAQAPVLGGVNKEAEEGRRQRASQWSACILFKEVVSNLAFQYSVWEVAGHTSQGSG